MAVFSRSFKNALFRFDPVTNFTSMRSFYRTNQLNSKVAVLGASGGLGQTLSLLLKLNPLVSHLALYDLVQVPGMTADLSHCSTKSLVTGHVGPQQLKECLHDAKLVVITAGVSRQPGMTRNDLFHVNASVVKDMSDAVAKNSPESILCIISDPINSVVPIASEVFKHRGVYDPKRIFGVTTLDVIRANTFIARAKGLKVHNIICPVVGGHSSATIVPLISQCLPSVSFPYQERVDLTKKIQNAGTEVVEAKAGSGSAVLSMSYAGNNFITSVLKALQGDTGIIECAYVRSDVTDAAYFASPILLGKNGMESNFGIQQSVDFEWDLVKKAIPELKKDIKKGEDYLKKNPLDD